MYNFYMKLSAKELIKLLLMRRNVRQKDLAEMLSQKTGKKYTTGSLSQKISRGSLLYDEVVIIADILDYNVEISEKN